MPSAASASLPLPSANDMQAQLRTSGILEAQTVAPQPTVQSIPQLQTPVVAPTGQLQANLAHSESVEEEAVVDTYGPMIWLKRTMPSIVAAVLTLQGLRGIYASMVFIFVEFPLLEEALIHHQITREQVNGFASKAIVTIISTVFSMFFAMHLAFLKSKVFKLLQTAIGVLLIASNQVINNYFQQLNSGEVIATYSTSLLETLYLQFIQFISYLGL